MDFSKVIGIGVAGNFSGHLEDANESNSFSSLQTTHAEAPKGIFPFYVPGNIKDEPLHVNPLSSNQIILPPQNCIVQAEPELALLCNLEYQSNLVKRIQPTYFAASNDCSIRSAGGKLSSKKNWGEASHGISEHFIPLDSFKSGGVLDHYRLASYIKRDGTYHVYGVNSEVSTYAYFYSKLIEWLIDRMNNQEDEGPLENFPKILKNAKYPKQALIFIGATRYETFGKNESLQPADEILIFLYNSLLSAAPEILKSIEEGTSLPTHCSLLHQVVKAAIL